jgi:hypothetical protein
MAGWAACLNGPKLIGLCREEIEKLLEFKSKDLNKFKPNLN